MSQDDLPQPSLSPANSGDLDATQTAGTPSADAPTTPPSRRRRAVAARKVDAASPSEAPSEPIAESIPTPAEAKIRRAPRPRKANLPSEDTPSPTVTPVESSSAPLPVSPANQETPAAARPARAPRRRKTAESESEIVSPVAPADTVASSDSSETASPAVEAESPAPSSRRGSRSRRPKAEAGTIVSPETPIEVNPVAENTSEADVIVEVPATEKSNTRGATSTRSRRRTQGKDKVVIAEGVSPAAEGLAISETTLDDVPLPTPDGLPLASKDGVPTIDIERGSRRRRGGRGRRGKGGAEGEDEIDVTNEVEIDDAVTPLPTMETEEERNRNARRGGRTRRTREMPTVPAVVARSNKAGTVIAEIAPPAPYVEPEPVIDTSIGVHLILQGGVADIHIDGKAVSPVFFFGNLDDQSSRPKVFTEIRHAAKAGIHLHSTLMELPCPLTEESSAIDRFDERIRLMLEADPDGFIMPRVLFAPAKGWRREYPTDISLYSDGSTGDPALTSERFWAEAERSLISLIAHVKEHSWGDRIFGYHLERGEWFQPSDQGYDRSIANRDAFRDWLREKYKDNLVSLRAAWYSAEVQFHTAEIPAPAAKPDLGRAFYAPRKERPIMDFHEFTSEITASRLAKLAKVIKKAADHKVLVSVCYGYTLEFGHGFSGHLALGNLLKSPHIDLLCGPPSYRDRKPGGAASLPALTGSINLHGKLWLSEDDTKTYLAANRPEDDAFNPRMPDLATTEQAHLRAMGKAFVRNTGVGLMDLWGEGWLDSASLWEKLGEFASDFGKVRGLQSRRDGAESPDVVVLLDERSLLHIQRGEPFFRRLTNGLRDTLQRAGIRYELYLQSDVMHPDFPTDAKLYLFATPYRLPIDQRKAISDRLQGGNRTLVWLYAPGTCERRPSFDFGVEEGTGSIIGMTLRPQEWNSEIGSRVIVPNHPIFNKLRGREIGVRERFNPSFFVDDPDAQTLAEYGGSGLASVAVRDHGTWKSVFIGEPTLNADLLRGLCRFANVHRWTQYGEDIIEIGNGWISVHAVRDGGKALRLPSRVALYDFTAQKLVSDGAREHRFTLRGGQTNLFIYGEMARFEAMGLPNLSLSPGEREAEAASLSSDSSSSNPISSEGGEEAAEFQGKQERSFQSVPSNPSNRSGQSVQPERLERPEKPERLERTGRPERNERGARPERTPRTVALSADVSISTANIPNEDLATLEAILNMDIGALEEREESEVTEPIVAESLPVAAPPKAEPFQAIAEVMEPFDIEEDNGDPARRRRRGGRGKGRKQGVSISEMKDPENIVPEGVIAEEITITETVSFEITSFEVEAAGGTVFTPRPVDGEPTHDLGSPSEEESEPASETEEETSEPPAEDNEGNG